VKGSELIRVQLRLQSPALEAGLRALLEADSQIHVAPAGAALSGEFDQQAADVFILTSAAFASRREPAVDSRLDGAVIVLGATAQDIERLWRGGASWGVLPMDASGEELRSAVQAVAAGLVVGPRPLLAASNERLSAPGPLTDREVEILGMLLRGLANKQIAVQLGISEHTVKFHVSSIYTKLNVSNRTEAVREGLRNGWITL
jgi:DNA-binding NarL/FixJ family response regulator